jgi:hypothetical protein
MTLNVGSHHLHVSLALLAGVALALYVYVQFGAVSLPLDTWLASGRQEIATLHGVLVRDQVHAEQADSARRAAARLNDSLTGLLPLLDSLRTAGLSLAAGARTLPQAREAAEVLARANTACFDALTLCRKRGDSLALADSLERARGDSLRAALFTADTTLKRGLAVVECHLIDAGPIKLFGCPSRSQALLLGLAGGIVGTLVLHR